MADSNLIAEVRGNATPDYSQGDARVGQTNRGELLVAQGALPKMEQTRLGQTWTLQIATGSAFTNVANMPTTLAELVLYNGEPDVGKHYVIDTAWFLSLTSVTAAANVTLIYQVGAAIAAPTDDANQLINSPTGATYGGLAKRAVSDTTFTANKWAALACSPAGAAASIGLGVFAEVNGGIILPPGASLGLNAVVGTATGTSLIGVSWSEVQF